MAAMLGRREVVCTHRLLGVEMLPTITFIFCAYILSPPWTFKTMRSSMGDGLQASVAPIKLWA